MTRNEAEKSRTIRDSLHSISAEFKEMRNTHTSSGSAIYEKSGSVTIVTMPTTTRAAIKE